MHNVINPCTQRSLHDSMGVLSARAHISMCKCLQHGDFSDRALQLLNIVESWMKIWKSQSVMGPKWLHNVSALQEPGGVLNYCSIIWPYQGQKKNFAKAPILPALLPWRFGDPGHVRVKQLRTQKYRIRSYIFLNLWYTNTGRKRKKRTS